MTSAGLKNETGFDNLKELTQLMRHSLVSSFREDVWHACRLEHPDDERKREEARKRLEAQELEEARRKLQEQVIVKLEGGVDLTSVVLGPAHVSTGKAIQQLSSESGLPMLDVEELHDIFSKHVPGGTMILEGPRFGKILEEIWTSPTEDDEESLYSHFKKVRMARAEEEHPDLDEWDPEIVLRDYSFRDFFWSVHTWLSLQDPETLSQMCKLTRFSLSKLDTLIRKVEGAGDYHEAVNVCNEIAESTACNDFALKRDTLQAEIFFDLSMRMKQITDRLYIKASGDRASADKKRNALNLGKRAMQIRWTTALGDAVPASLPPAPRSGPGVATLPLPLRGGPNNGSRPSSRPTSSRPLSRPSSRGGNKPSRQSRNLDALAGG